MLWPIALMLGALVVVIAPAVIAWRRRERTTRLMAAYLLRRLLYAIPILIGVNLLTFALFFVVNTPDDMARCNSAPST